MPCKDGLKQAQLSDNSTGEQSQLIRGVVCSSERQMQSTRRRNPEIRSLEILPHAIIIEFFLSLLSKTFMKIIA